MKYSPKIYSALLLGVLKDGWQSERVKKFLSLVRKNKDLSRMPQIFREFKKSYNRANGFKDVEIRLAREDATAVASVRTTLGLKYAPAVVIDKEILGGMVVTIDEDMVVDGSVRTKISKLF